MCSTYKSEEMMFEMQILDDKPSKIEREMLL